MRKKVIAGNWKMNLDLNESISLISELKNELKGKEINCDVVICPPFISLDTAKELTKDSVIELGAQNIYFEESGAYTGEISAKMIISVGCKYVILGHSERRTIFHESDDYINRKIVHALKNNLIPIFCVGETLEERENNTTFNVIKRQITVGLIDITKTDFEKVIIAYEPVWAIGTGKTASPEQAEEVHKYIRNLIEEIYDAESAAKVIIQYGGSVKPDNAKELLSQPNIDGALVGGACLKADSFLKIIQAC